MSFMTSKRYLMGGALAAHQFELVGCEPNFFTRSNNRSRYWSRLLTIILLPYDRKFVLGFENFQKIILSKIAN